MFFLIYDLLLLLGGIAMIVLGLAIREQSTGSRVLNILVGLAFFCYGFYLMFLFDGGSYRVFIYVFVLPILLIVRTIKARKEAREQAAAHQFAAAPPPGQYAQPGQFGGPAQYGQPGQPAPGQFGQPVPGQPGQPVPFPEAHPAQLAPPAHPGHGHYAPAPPPGPVAPQAPYAQPQGQPGYPNA